MTPPTVTKDLVILVADGQMEAAIRGLLTRGPSLQIRAISFDIWVHPEKDPGCFRRGQDFLRPFTRQYDHALVVHDREGCGRDNASREALESDIESRLASSGWMDRAAAVVIDPELEVWVWSESPEVGTILGWAEQPTTLAQWLVQRGYCSLGRGKPPMPKKVLDEALQAAGKRRSSSIFRQLAERVSVHRCRDRAFLKLKALLQAWFPATA